MKANSQSQGLFVCLFSRCIGEKQERDKTRRDSEDPGGDRDGAPCWSLAASCSRQDKEPPLLL